MTGTDTPGPAARPGAGTVTGTATGRAVGTRTVGTFGLYAAYGALGYVLAGLGVILPELRAEDHLPRAEAALYPSGFAFGLLVVGVAGHPVARRLGALGIPVALVALAGGCAVLVAGGRVVAALGAVLLGLGGAFLVQLVPARLRRTHGDVSAVPIGEANAVSSTGSVLAPLLVGAAIGTGLGWRPGFLVVPVALSAVALVLLTRRDPAAAAIASRTDDRPDTPGFAAWWLTIVLAVAVEFSTLFWAADLLHSVQGLPAGLASGTSAAFVLGMAAGRAASAPVLRRFAGPRRVLVAGTAVALAGALTAWAAPAPAVAVAGLLLIGLGVALLYPVTLAQALATRPSDPGRAAGRCALASGVAIASAPPLLGALADAAGLHTAFLLVPALLLVLLARAVIGLLRSLTAGVSR